MNSMLRRKYLPRNPKRKIEILDKALKLSDKITYVCVNYANLSHYSKLSPQLISHYFKSNLILQKELILYAIEKEHLSIIAQGIAANDSLLLRKASTALKIKALQFMGERI